MLTPQQTEIFLANMEDFILTRGIFYSQKTYPGLEDYANNLDETIIGEGLISKEAREAAEQSSRKAAEQLQSQLNWRRREEWEDRFSRWIEWLAKVKSIYGQTGGSIRFFFKPIHPILNKWIKGEFRCTRGHSVKTFVSDYCRTIGEVNNCLSAFDKLWSELERGERGQYNEIWCWNYLESRVQTGLFESQRWDGSRESPLAERQKWEPAIKAWEQRNGVSFHGNWNWENLLGREISREIAFSFFPQEPQSPQEKEATEPLTSDNTNLASSKSSNTENSPNSPTTQSETSPANPKPVSPKESNPRSNTLPTKANPTEQPKEKDLAKNSQANSPEPAKGKEITATELVVGGIIVSLILVSLAILIKKRKVKYK